MKTRIDGAIGIKLFLTFFRPQIEAGALGFVRIYKAGTERVNRFGEGISFKDGHYHVEQGSATFWRERARQLCRSRRRAIMSKDFLFLGMIFFYYTFLDIL